MENRKRNNSCAREDVNKVLTTHALKKLIYLLNPYKTIRYSGMFVIPDLAMRSPTITWGLLVKYPRLFSYGGSILLNEGCPLASIHGQIWGHIPTHSVVQMKHIVNEHLHTETYTSKERNINIYKCCTLIKDGMYYNQKVTTPFRWRYIFKFLVLLEL